MREIVGYFFLWDQSSQKYRLCSTSAALARLMPKPVSCSFICKLGFYQCMYTFTELFPDVIYVSVSLSIELIFSGESLLLFNASMKERQKEYFSFINLCSQIGAILRKMIFLI